MLRTRVKARPRVTEKVKEVKKSILRDLRTRPVEYVEGWKVPKGGE